MRIAVKYTFGQLCIFIIILALSSCVAKKDEAPVIPPVTSPLSRDYIGYGVITSSFTHITADPSETSEPIGYLRRGSLVRIIRRQIIRTRNEFVSWVLADGNPYGWLKEEVMDIYDSEDQAKTASETMPK
jgi:hypothetical protein